MSSIIILQNMRDIFSVDSSTDTSRQATLVMTHLYSALVVLSRRIPHAVSYKMQRVRAEAPPVFAS